MFRVVFLQILTTGAVALCAGLLGGPHAAISALLGGAACWIPNGLFALRLAVASERPQGSSVADFFLGEFIKVATTLMLLAAMVWLYKDLVWLAMLVSFIAVLKSYMLALFIK